MSEQDADANQLLNGDLKKVAVNPLTCISQKTGSRFVKTHGLYKNRPS